MAFRAKVNRAMIGVLLVVGAVVLMVMMAVIVGNSLGRVFFKTPIFGAIEFAGLAGVILVAVAIGFAERERVNIVVRVVFERFPGQVRIILESITLLLSLGGVAYLFWAILKSALKSLSIHEATITTGVAIPPFKFFWAAGALLLCLFLAQHLIEDIIKQVKK